jgi:hypothetical protein
MTAEFKLSRSEKQWNELSVVMLWSEFYSEKQSICNEAVLKVFIQWCVDVSYSLLFYYFAFLFTFIFCFHAFCTCTLSP